MAHEITGIEAIKARIFKTVEIPDFGDGQPVYFLLRKVSMLNLAKAGKIPNQLMQVVADLFKQGATTEEQIEKTVGNDKLKEMAQILDVMCDAIMVEPKYSEVAEYLSDEQKTFMFNWSQGEVAKIAPSVENTADRECDSNVPELPYNA